MELARCEQIAARETIQRRDAREREQAQLRRDAARREAAIRRKEAIAREKTYAEIRRNPRAPEIGATLPEVARICRQQSGDVEREGETSSVTWEACALSRQPQRVVA